MKNTGIHIIDLPRRVVVGSNIIGKIGDYARSLFPDAERIAVITGKIVGSRIYPLVEESMREKDSK